MPDISKCLGSHCEVKETCYRYAAPSSDYWQSYITPEKPGKDCEFYWKEKVRE
jgi:hypothetical protein